MFPVPLTFCIILPCILLLYLVRPASRCCYVERKRGNAVAARGAERYYAGELAALQAETARKFVAELGGDHRWKVMSDLSGPFDTIVMEVEVASLAEWEGMRSRMFASATFREAMATTMGAARAMTVSGRTEYWTVEGQG